jgi:hypothetical protein
MLELTRFGGRVNSNAGGVDGRLGSEDVPDDRSELLLLVKAGGLPVTVIAVVYCWQVVPRRSRVGGGDAVAPIPLGLVEGGVGAGEDGVRRSVRGLQGRHPDADGN